MPIKSFTKINQLKYNVCFYRLLRKLVAVIWEIQLPYDLKSHYMRKYNLCSGFLIIKT